MSDAEVKALRSWINSDESNAVQFVEFAVLHAAITERLRLDRLLDDLASHRSAGGISPALLANAIREIELNSPRVLQAPRTLEPASDSASVRWPAAATVAVTAATLLIAAMGLWRNSSTIPFPQETTWPRAATRAVAAPQAVAMLSTSFDATWRGKSLSSRDELFAGPSLSLLRGVAELEMKGGAVVVIEGPTKFALAGPDSLKLIEGKAAVRVAGGGEPFVINTSTIQVVDLGTEFGVESIKSGATQIMVFDGSVALADHGAENVPDAVAVAPRLDAGFQVNFDAIDQPLASAVSPHPIANDRYFMRPDEIAVRHRALQGSEFDRRLAEHYERQRIKGLLAYQPFDPGSGGQEFSIGMSNQGVFALADVAFTGSVASGAIDVSNGPAFICLDASPAGPLARGGFLKSNGLVGQSGREIWLTWTTERLQSMPDSDGSAGLSLMFGDRSDLDEPIFIGRGYGLTEEFCIQSAWNGGAPPAGPRIDVHIDLDASQPGIQAGEVDDVAHRWLARVEFRDGTDRVSIWMDQDAALVDLDAPQAIIDDVDVEFDRVRLAVNRQQELWRFGNFAAAADLNSLIQLKHIGDYTIDK